MKHDEFSNLAAQWRENNAPPSSLEARMLGEFRKKHQPAPKSRVRILWPLMAAAAALAIAAVTGAFTNRPKPDPNPVAVQMSPIESVQQPTPPTLPPPVIAAAIKPAPIVRHKASPKPKAAPSPVIPVENASTREVYTDFYPLEEGPLRIDRGSVVRVRVPRSAMFKVGLPVNMNRLNDSIQADLVLSEDGIARAVRFVQ